MIKSIYCIGIGGVGMSSLALYLREAGYIVSGSDVTDFRLRKLLESKDITVFLQHRAKQIIDHDLIIYSTAIPNNNPEFVQAKLNNVPMMNRLTALQKFLSKQKIISITGSYGKSTTSAFCASIMNQIGLLPSWLIGADLFSFPPSKNNFSSWTVLETDESKPEFLDFSPHGVIVTNVGIDHLQNYGQSINQLFNTLTVFLSKRDKKTKIIINGDDINSLPFLSQFDRDKELILCGLGEINDYQISSLKTMVLETCLKTSFTLTCPDHTVHDCEIPMPGVNNAIDAVLSLAMAVQLGGDIKECIQSLSKLPLLDRRFEICRFSQTCVVVDDEGDSPEVISQVLQNGKMWYPDKKIIAVLQPHRFTRLKNLFNKYREALVQWTDEIVLLPVFHAGENEIPGINSVALKESIELTGYPAGKINVLSMEETITYLLSKLNQSCLIITLGPGDIWKIADALRSR